MSGSTPPPPDIKSGPDTPIVETTPQTGAVPTPEVTELAATIATQAGAIQVDQPAAQTNPDKQNLLLNKVPAFDLRKLQRSVIEFVIKLKNNLPAQKAESVDVMKDQLKMTIVEIGMMAQELKGLHANLTPAQSQKLSETVEAMPQLDPLMEDFFAQCETYWNEQLEMLTSLLTQLQNKGMAIFGKVDQQGFQVDKPFLQELSPLLDSMLKSLDQFAKKVYMSVLEDGEKERLFKMKQDIMTRINDSEKFTGIATEDMGDAEVDESLYQELLKDLETDKSPKELAQNLTTAIAINFNRLRNAIAAQSGSLISGYLFFLEDIEDEKGLYETGSPDNLFKSEAYAATYLLTTLNRCLSGILSSQKLADLIRQSKKDES